MVNLTGVRGLIAEMSCGGSKFECVKERVRAERRDAWSTNMDRRIRAKSVSRRRVVVYRAGWQQMVDKPLSGSGCFEKLGTAVPFRSRP